MKENGVIPYRHEVLKKSNFFIGAKYKASTLENQIVYLAMLKIQEHEYEERGDGFYVVLPASYIKSEINTNNGSFYNRLKRVASEMTGNNIGIVDDENERFDFITMINKASYSDGEFTIRFALELRDHLVNVQSRYTKVPKKIAMSLRKRAGSLQLYQILKQQCYYPDDYKGHKDYVFSVVIGLSELKLDIGLINIKDSPEVRRALLEGKGTEADYDRAVEKSKDKMYNSWSDFDRKCLQKIVNEINENSDIYVEYTKKVKGRGGKVYAVDFTVWLNGSEVSNKDSVRVTVDTAGNLTSDIDDTEKFKFYVKIFPLFEKYNVTIADVMSISEQANYNYDKVKHASELLEKANGVENVTGWVISCIKDGWTETPGSTKKHESTNQFHKFQERATTDAELQELEKMLLGAKK